MRFGLPAIWSTTMSAPAVALAIGLAGTACSALPTDPVGLDCSSPAGAHVRFNIDIGARRFEKEGFPAYPIVSVDARRIVLTRFKDRDIAMLASIDRRTLVYSALSKDLATGAVSKTDYRCVAGSPFDVAPAP